MNKFIWILAFALIMASCNSFKPPGTLDLPENNDRFLDRGEVTNFAWYEYVSWMQNEHGPNSQEFLQAIPDTNLWLEAYHGPVIMSEEFEDHPVVGITYEQAQDFCEWRSRLVSKRFEKNVTYQLPEEEDYEYAYQNYSPSNGENLYSVRPNLVRRYVFPRFIGLFNNAAEMTQERGIAIKGVNEEGEPETVPYKGPDNNLSFRCIAIVEEEEENDDEGEEEQETEEASP